MAKARSDTIVLKGFPLIKEGLTSIIISPGHLIEIGGTQDIRLQSVAKRNCSRNFALEDTNLGKEIIDDYEVDTRVRYGAFAQGMELQAVVGANSPAIVRGDALESAGDGSIRKFTDGFIIAYALESIDNSTVDTKTMIKIEVC